MTRFCSLLTTITSCSLLFGLGATVNAEVDPTFCTIIPADNLDGVVLGPALPSAIPASINVITVKNNTGAPISNAPVLALLGAGNGLCGTTVLTGTTNGSGQLTMALGGGGCAHNATLSAIFKVYGVTFRAYRNAKSPDFDGASGNLSVTLADLIQFSNEFLDVEPNECHDYDNDGNTGLSDLIVFSPTFTNPNSCAP